MRFLTRLENLERKIALPGGQCQCNDAASVTVARIGATHYPTDHPSVVAPGFKPTLSRCPSCNRQRSQITINYVDRLPQPD